MIIESPRPESRPSPYSRPVDEPVRPSWCEIDLDAISNNVAQVRSLVGPSVSVFVCLKNDAIGCGAVRVSRHCEQIGVDGLAFGNLDSAIACRSSGVTLPILLYPTCLPKLAPIVEAMNMMPTISTLEEVDAWTRHCRGQLKVFLKIDGGGYRAGALPNSAHDVALAIKRSDKLVLTGVYGHPMADYGFDAPDYVNSQILAILSCIRSLESLGIDPKFKMVSSSSILLNYPEADLNCVDPGRLVMGISFASKGGRTASWKRAVRSIKSRLVTVKSLDHHGQVPEPPFFERQFGMRIGLIPLGWADGFTGGRTGDTEVLVRGCRARIFGPIHAELTRVDLTQVVGAEIGDEVVILGRSGGDEITMDDICGRWKMADDEIYMSFAKNLKKIYVGG